MMSDVQRMADELGRCALMLDALYTTERSASYLLLSVCPVDADGEPIRDRAPPVVLEYLAGMERLALSLCRAVRDQLRAIADGLDD